MAKKVHHWKHGWIPLDAFARRVLAGRKDDQRGSASADDMKSYRRGLSQVGSDDMKSYRDALRSDASHTVTHSPDEERRARYAAHLAETADKRVAQEQRYRDHLAATASKEAERRARYLAAQNRKH